MTPDNRPTRDTPHGRAYLDLQNAARRAGRDTSEYLALYALEGFLARLGQSRFAPDLVLKGGVLLAAYAPRRPTRDIDLQATRISNDVDEVVTLVREIAALPRDDGLVFDLDTLTGRDIRDEDPYAGVRVSITAQLATATIPFHVDVNFGDPIWPQPATVELPLLLGGRVRLLGYPAHMILAEKIATAVERGTVNTRWRDFATSPPSAPTRASPAATSNTACASSPPTATWPSCPCETSSPTSAGSPSRNGPPGDADNDSRTQHPPSSTTWSRPAATWPTPRSSSRPPNAPGTTEPGPRQPQIPRPPSHRPDGWKA